MQQKVLVVDGDAQSLRLLEISLRQAGYRVTTAQSGQDALSQLEAELPDLVLADTHIGELDGFALYRQLQQRPEWSHLPFLFLLDGKDPSEKLRAVQLGATDFLVKPIFLKEALLRVELLLEKHAQRGDGTTGGQARFQGALSGPALLDLMQTMELGKKSGVVYCQSARGQRGLLYFTDGRLIDCELGRLRGEDALSRLLTFADGDYRVELLTVLRPPRIELLGSGLLMEAMRRLDEWNRLLATLPPLQTVFSPATAGAMRPEALPPELREILARFDGRRSVLDVFDLLDSEGSPPHDALVRLQAVAKLYAARLLLPSGRPISGEPRAAVPTPMALPRLTPSPLSRLPQLTPPPVQTAALGGSSLGQRPIASSERAVYESRGRLRATDLPPPPTAAELAARIASATQGLEVRPIDTDSPTPLPMAVVVRPHVNDAEHSGPQPLRHPRVTPPPIPSSPRLMPPSQSSSPRLTPPLLSRTADSRQSSLGQASGGLARLQQRMQQPVLSPLQTPQPVQAMQSQTMDSGHAAAVAQREPISIPEFEVTLEHAPPSFGGVPQPLPPESTIPISVRPILPTDVFDPSDEAAVHISAPYVLELAESGAFLTTSGAPAATPPPAIPLSTAAPAGKRFVGLRRTLVWAGAATLFGLGVGLYWLQSASHQLPADRTMPTAAVTAAESSAAPVPALQAAAAPPAPATTLLAVPASESSAPVAGAAVPTEAATAASSGTDKPSSGVAGAAEKSVGVPAVGAALVPSVTGAGDEAEQAFASLIAQIKAAQYKDQTQQARRLLKEAQKLRPRSPQVTVLLAQQALDEGDSQKAAKLARQTLAMARDSAEAYLVLGTLAQAEGNMPKARGHFRKYLQLAPNGERASAVKDVLRMARY